MSDIRNIYFVSDIHMGTNAQTNWYQSEIHDGFFSAFLQHVLDSDEDNREVVILGDLFDLWTYPVDQTPPTAADVVAAHPNILGAAGLFAQLPKKGVKVSYANGNHDMAVTKADLSNAIPGADYIDDGMYKYKVGNDIKIIGMHGHGASIYNARRLPGGPENPLPEPLPLGYLMTRLTANYAVKRIAQEGVNTAADLKDNGDPSFGSFSLEDFESVFGEILKLVIENYRGKDLARISVDLICRTAKIDLDHQLLLPGGGATTIRTVANAFHNLTALWVAAYGESFAKKALEESEKGNLDWIVAIPNAKVFWSGVDVSNLGGDAVVVMGHTHKPAHAPAQPEFHTPTYWNCGFNCPSKPDMQGPSHKKKHATFVKVEVDGAKITPAAYKVVHVDGVYKVNKMNMNGVE